jgi:LacI family transcriptional regulator
VAVDRPLPGRPSDTVLVDTRRAAREATEHLLAQGYSRIACITGPAGVRTADDRLAGYTDGLPAGSPALVRRTGFAECDGARACASLLDEAEPPDALLVASNGLALGVLWQLRARSLRAGTDVGVVAFDDVPWAGVTDPPLTVVAQPAYEIGAEAARLLLARVGGGSREAVTRVLGARLIERASSRRAG